MLIQNSETFVCYFIESENHNKDCFVIIFELSIFYQSIK